MKNFLKLLISIVVCNLAGFIGSIFTTPSIPNWYANINKPSFTPPNWIFAPVWITLFILMGVSLFLIIKNWQNNRTQKIAIYLFTVQLILNTLWSLIFFGLQKPGLAFIEIIILLFFIILTAWQTKKVNKLAAYLFIPYILWVSFATILNFSIWLLN